MYCCRTSSTGCTLVRTLGSLVYLYLGTKFDEMSLMIVVRGIKEYVEYQEDNTRMYARRDYQSAQLVMVGLVL